MNKKTEKFGSALIYYKKALAVQTEVFGVEDEERLATAKTVEKLEKKIK